MENKKRNAICSAKLRGFQFLQYHAPYGVKGSYLSRHVILAALLLRFPDLRTLVGLWLYSSGLRFRGLNAGSLPKGFKGFPSLTFCTYYSTGCVVCQEKIFLGVLLFSSTRTDYTCGLHNCSASQCTCQGGFLNPIPKSSTLSHRLVGVWPTPLEQLQYSIPLSICQPLFAKKIIYNFGGPGKVKLLQRFEVVSFGSAPSIQGGRLVLRSLSANCAILGIFAPLIFYKGRRLTDSHGSHAFELGALCVLRREGSMPLGFYGFSFPHFLQLLYHRMVSLSRGFLNFLEELGGLPFPHLL